MRRRMKGKCYVLGGVWICVISLMSAMPVHAEQKGITPENFDYGWYLERHPDLAAVIPDGDREMVWNFYQVSGKPAGWNGRIAREYITESRKAYTTDKENEAVLKIYDLAETITKDCTTDSQRINAVHDWMVRNIAYDYDNYLAGTIPDRSYNLQGAVFYGKAVCSGYARTFNTFMDVLGIECECVSGYGNGGGHEWNRVMLNGSGWRYIDVTWDDPVPDQGPDAPIEYTYYMVEDPTFGGTHTLDSE